MNLPEIGEIVTPVDDPCQFNPAWRSLLANYLFSVGRWTKEGLDTLARTGCVTVTRTVTRTETVDEKQKGAKSKSKKVKKTVKKTVVEKTLRPVTPFKEHPEYRIFASDRWVATQIEWLNSAVDGSATTDNTAPYKLAQRWYEEPESEAAMRKRLEAMLLTEIGLDVIAFDLLGAPSAAVAVEAYERLYFNCRDDQFNLNQSTQLVMRMAMPYGPLKAFLRKWEHLDDDGFCEEDGRPIAKDSDVWRAVAATMGYEPLMYMWRWEGRAHGIKDRTLMHMMEVAWRASVARLMSDMFTGTISHEDTAKALAAFTMQMKFISDDKKDGGEGDDTTKALLAILEVAAPKMRALVPGSAGMITDNDIQTRIAAQQAINKQEIYDAGKQVSNEIIDAQITEAIER